MKKGTMWMLALATILAILAAPVWSDASVLWLGIAPAAVIAAAMVMYFKWRANLRRRILAEAEDYRRAA